MHEGVVVGFCGASSEDDAGVGVSFEEGFVDEDGGRIGDCLGCWLGLHWFGKGRRV